jgi:hypothetical protein
MDARARALCANSNPSFGSPVRIFEHEAAVHPAAAFAAHGRRSARSAGARFRPTAQARPHRAGVGGDAGRERV